MAGYVLHLTEEKNVVLAAPTVRRLIELGSGDAALLYLCLARSDGGMTHEKLCAELRWSERQLESAEAALSRIGLVGPTEAAAPAREAPPPPREEQVTPAYTERDVADALEGDAVFSGLLAEVERKLGKLSSLSVKKLLGLYAELGLPADVIYLLVNHCIVRKAAQYGAGRLPTMREIEKEGYLWERLGLFSVEKADGYLRAEQEKRRRYPDYMAVLQLSGRAVSPGEEKYLSTWTEMGFPPETVAIAYDKTVLKCHEFKWPYCNGILKRWHEKGLHTPEEVSGENRPAAAKSAGGDRNAWMDKYM